MAIASGVIIAWPGTNASIPSGWSRKTSLDDSFPLGSAASTNPDTTGGASTHTHPSTHTHTGPSHTHSAVTTSAAAGSTSLGSGATARASLTHTHQTAVTGAQTSTLSDGGSVVTGSGSSVPSAYTVIWIESNGTPAGFPSNSVVFSNETSAPSGWTAQAGPAGVYLVGAAAGADGGGTTGGTHNHSGASHNHPISSHAHTIGASGAPSATANFDTNGTGTSVATSTHTHTETISSTPNTANSGNATSTGTSGSAATDPPYRKLVALKNTSGADAVAVRAIALWLGTLASIPSPWVLCDGSNGTPDMRDKMLVGGATDFTDVGTSGGATTHGHTSFSTHTHTVSHTHNVTITADGGGANNQGFGTNQPTAGHTHSPAVASGAASSTTSGSTAEAVTSNTSYPPYRTVAFIQMQAQVITPTGIASEEAFGTASVNRYEAPTGIASEEAFGTPVVAGPITATGIASEEAFGTAQLNRTLPVVGIASEEAVGTPVVQATALLTVVAIGIASEEAFGTAVVTLTVHASGIASEEAFGTATVNLTVHPSGVTSEEAFGTPTVAFYEAPTGIASEEAFGTAVVVLTVHPSGIASEETFGTASVMLTVAPSGIASEEAFGTPVVAGPITATGIASEEAFGTASVTLGVTGAGIASEEAFGTATIRVYVAPSGIASAEAFGTLRVNLKISPSGIASQEIVSTPGLVQIVHPSGIASEEAFGTATVRRSLPPAPASTTPTSEQIATALSALRGSSVRFRYYRYSRDGALVEDITEAITDPGTVTLDNRRAVVRDLEIKVDRDRLPEGWNFSSDVLGAVMEVYVPEAAQWAAIPVGRFLLDVSDVRYRDDRTTLECQGSDLGLILARHTRSAPYTVAAGTQYTAAVEALLENHGVPYAVPSSSAVTPQAFTWGPGSTDWEITRDLLLGINYYPVWADASGVFRTRARIDPSTETIAVRYQDTAEPRMVSAEQEYVRREDPKLPNRCVVIIDDPRNTDYGYAHRENTDPDLPNSTYALAFGTAVTITTSSANDPSVLTTATAHGVQTEVTVLVEGHSGSTPAIDGSHIVTKISDTAFSIPINVTTGGTGGTARPTTTQMLVLDGDSDPPTKCVEDATVAGEIADFELRWAAMLSRTAELPTLLDPRREAHEWYQLDLDGIEDETLWGVVGWKLPLEPGKTMVHDVGLAESVTVITPPKI